MRTNTRVEFGLYDVTARGDSAPSCTTAKPFCNLGRDLLLESVPSQNKYGTLESEQWLMDGSFSFFPEVPEQYFWGLWSTTQSDKSGVFPDPPVLDITFTQDHSSSGLTLHFYSPTRRRTYLYGAFLPGRGRLLLCQERRELPPHSHSFS